VLRSCRYTAGAREGHSGSGMVDSLTLVNLEDIFATP
jgi:hypothetical protein